MDKEEELIQSGDGAAAVVAETAPTNEKEKAADSKGISPSKAKRKILEVADVSPEKEKELRKAIKAYKKAVIAKTQEKEELTRAKDSLFKAGVTLAIMISSAIALGKGYSIWAAAVLTIPTLIDASEYMKKRGLPSKRRFIEKGIFFACIIHIIMMCYYGSALENGTCNELAILGAKVLASVGPLRAFAVLKDCLNTIGADDAKNGENR